MQGIWLLAIAAATIYTGLYFAFRKWIAPERIAEFSSRVITLLHAVLSIALSIYCCFYEGPFPFTTPDVDLTPVQTFALTNSLGYFVFDLVWCLFYKTEGPVMLAHHILSIFALSRAIHVGFNGAECVAGLGLLEITNPFLQARWFLRFYGYNNTIQFYIVEGVFLFNFVIVRIVLGTHLIRKYALKTAGSMRDVLYYFTAIYIISWLFYIGMLRYIWRKYVLQVARQNETAL